MMLLKGECEFVSGRLMTNRAPVTFSWPRRCMMRGCSRPLKQSDIGHFQVCDHCDGWLDGYEWNTPDRITTANLHSHK